MEQVTKQVKQLEVENATLKQVIKKLQSEWTDSNKPMACEFCKYYIKHYVKQGVGFMEIYAGHCTRSRSIKKRRKHDDTCSYFELGDYKMKGIEL